MYIRHSTDVGINCTIRIHHRQRFGIFTPAHIVSFPTKAAQRDGLSLWLAGVVGPHQLSP